MKKIILIITITTLLCPLLLQTAQAGLMRSFVQGSSSNQQIVDGDSNIDRTIATNVSSVSYDVYNQVWAGASIGGGISNAYNGGFETFGKFTIDDIIITYTGENVPESSQVNGAVHITNYVNLVQGHPNSFLDLVLTLGSANYFNSKNGSSLANNLFTWSVATDFSLNQAFSLTYSSRLGVGNIKQPNGSFAGIGLYQTVLGGSPVFNLPTGYSANSADGSIVNNYYRGYNPLAPVNQVPEPSTFWLLLATAVIFFTQLRQANKV